MALSTPISRPDAALSPPSTGENQESRQARPPTLDENHQSLLAEAQMLATDYAASFVPGVYGEEPVPQFAEPLLGITAAGSREDLLCSSDLSCYSKYLRDYSGYRRGLADDWSAGMALFLRSFFDASPEFARKRIAVSCRASQCKVQMITVYELPDVFETSQPKILDRVPQGIHGLKQKAWYRENFIYVNRVHVDLQDNSFRSRRILHELWTLQRRDGNDESQAQ